MSTQGLVAHWPFLEDCEDRRGARTVNHGVRLTGEGPAGRAAARFDGAGAHLEVAGVPAFGAGDFSLAAWVHTERDTDLVGDILGNYDPRTRRGFHLSVVTNAGVTSTAQPNTRNLHFGTDDGGATPAWTDCGRPGNAVLISALKVFNSRLYAGTMETGSGEVGRLWRYEGGQEWRDLGNPAGCNAVQTIAEFDGALYCGVGRYNTHGSVLGEVQNPTPGGMVYRVEPGGRWCFAGHPGSRDAVPEDVPTSGYATGKADDAMSLTAYQGGLYCISNHRHGVFRYEGGEEWACVGPDARLLTLALYRGRLYVLANGGTVMRYEGGREWSDCGRPGTSTQTYGAVIHCGRLFVGTWPQGEVYRYEGDREWARVGSGPVGYEREIMAMALYNGKVYVGSLPMGNVWRMDGEGFTFVGNLDASPVPLRRVWSMAVFQGRLFAGTLPSGHVLSLEAGRMATCDRALPAGWHHLAAVREAGILRLYLDGAEVAALGSAGCPACDVDTDAPLRIGFGAHEHFQGMMSDVRLYNRALSAGEVAEL